MDDPTPNDRVPLDRPPVPRFSPLPDLPDMPELPRGSAIAPTPSTPIPAPPLPPPRVMVDLPRPSPSVSIDPPKPRPAPPTLSKPAAGPPVPTPTPVVASTPAPKGRWVGEAFATLVTPTKSKATVLAAAGSLVAGAFVLQLLVGSGGETASTKPSKTVEVSAAKKPAEAPPEESDPHSDPKPASNDAENAAWAKDKPFYVTGVAYELPGDRSDPFALDLPAPQTPAPSPIPVVASQGITPAAFRLPPVDVPTPPAIPGAPAPTPTPTPVPPIPTPMPVSPIPASVPVPALPPTPALPTPEPAKFTPVAVPAEAAKPITLPMTPAKPTDFPKLPETPAATPLKVEPVKPPVPAPPAFPEVPPPAVAPLPPTPAIPAAMSPIPAAMSPIPVTPALKFDDEVPQPKPAAPTPAPATDVRTSFDVDLHPAKVGQTYEAVSVQHYSDAKYADALRRFNKNRDPGVEELQIPPTHVLRKLAAGTRTPTAPATANPVTPAAGEAWSRPAALDGVKPVAAGRSYTVPQDGTTFRDLAGKLLNDRTLYQRISDLNPTYDSNAQLRKGDTIRVP